MEIPTEIIEATLAELESGVQYRNLSHAYVFAEDKAKEKYTLSVLLHKCEEYKVANPPTHQHLSSTLMGILIFS